MSTHNIFFYGKIRKMITELSPNIPPYQVFGLLSTGLAEPKYVLSLETM